MNISLNWVSALLGRAIDPEDAATRLGALGAPVEGVESLHADLGDVVVALVEAVEKHPNADRLTVCRVNHGRAVVEVVCGAPNVTAGRKYPYAPVGATLPGGVRLEREKIRGVVSNGMLCSARELGLGADHAGILELTTDAPPGAPLTDALPVRDTRLVVEVTANRPDLLCHKGVARELGAVYGVPVKLPVFPNAPADVLKPNRAATSGASDGVRVTIEDVEGCPRYMAALLRGVRVGPSPAWLEARLRSVGARPINNVVDATNYVLYELNQPLHAFDLAKLRGGRIIVRRAAAGERITTLDGEDRPLEPHMTMICDAEGPVAVAGVMGGLEAQVGPDTTEVLLECAYFDPVRIRATRKALKLSTEASYRFERGIDLHGMGEALRRAVQLIQAVAGGELRDAPVDVYPRPERSRAVFLRPERLRQVLGVEVPSSEVERLLVGIGFAVAPKDGRFYVQVPGWRPDVTREIDLVEEVARLWGYDRFPVEVRPLRPSTVPNDPVEPLKASLRRVLAAHGLHEARTLSIVAEHPDGAVPLVNPLSAEESYLRADLLPGLVRAVERNWANRIRDVRLFEIGTVFRRAPAGVRPEERLRVAAVVTGARTPPHWTAAGKAPDYDVWDIKAMFENTMRRAGMSGVRLVTRPDGWVVHDESGAERGRVGRLRADQPAWAAPLFGFEVDAAVGARGPSNYRPLPVTPAVERDVALVLPAGVTAGEVEAVLREEGGELLESLLVFDEYRGAELAGRSVAWRLVFRAPDRTLRDTEVDAVVSRMLTALEERFDVRRRS